jgi:CubicO group peptidase (beta-lactamase class C family)
VTRLFRRIIRVIKFYVCCCLTFVLVSAAQGETIAAVTHCEISSIKEILAKYRARQNVSGSLLVRKQGRDCDWEMGLANDGLSQGIGPDTVFAIASLSKSFAAAAVLKAFEGGSLKLYEPVRTYLPEFTKAQLSKNGTEVTVYHLLTHTSGIAEAYGMPSFYNKISRQKVEFAEVVEAIKNIPLKFEPGTRFEYLNTGYLMLGEIVHRVTGKSYRDFVTSNFLVPLNLAHTSVEFPTSKSDLVAKAYYTDDASHKGVRLDLWLDDGITAFATQGLFADTNVYSSTHDLATWGEAVTGGKVLNVLSTAAMLTPHLNEYGFGWIVFKDRSGNLAYEHSGDYLGYQSGIRIYPKTQTTIVWLGNQYVNDSDYSSFFESIAQAANSN